MKTIDLKFRGIDRFNRPVFQKVGTNRYYGSTDLLFSHGTSKKVIEKVIKDDGAPLVYFGESFGCEPDGTRLRKDVIINFVG